MLTIGNFDGVHLGHQRILQLCGEFASASSAKVVALTFEPPPDLVVRPGDVPRRLDTPGRKTKRLLQRGADLVVVAGSTKELLSMSSSEFVTEVIYKQFKPVAIFEGPDFRFGLGRAGNIETLKQMSAAMHLGYETHVVSPVQVELPSGPALVSSTLIRDLVASGDVANARKCLGRDFTLFGEVVKGLGIGKKMGTPTCNLGPSEQVLPRNGVYAGWATIGGKRHLAAISVGGRVTVSPGEVVVEAHLLDSSGDYYGQELALEFHTFLRDQELFEDIEALTGQISRDIVNVRKISR